MGYAELDLLLKAIGKRVFVEYYDYFKNENYSNQDVVDILPKEYTLNSRRSRTSHARKIFRESMEKDALKTIIESDKIDTVTIDLAKKILSKEIKHI